MVTWYGRVLNGICFENQISDVALLLVTSISHEIYSKTQLNYVILRSVIYTLSTISLFEATHGVLLISAYRVPRSLFVHKCSTASSRTLIYLLRSPNLQQTMFNDILLMMMCSNAARNEIYNVTSQTLSNITKNIIQTLGYRS